jgi:hypothetical protein
MTVKSKTLALALLLGILALPALADRRGPGIGSNDPGIGVDDSVLVNGRFLTRYLSLSSSQATQLQGFLRTFQTSLQAVQTSRAPLCRQLRTDLGASIPDPTTVGRDLLALVDNQGRVKAALQAFDNSFSAILNGDQLTRYDALKQAVGLNRKTPDLIPECPLAGASS